MTDAEAVAVTRTVFTGVVDHTTLVPSLTNEGITWVSIETFLLDRELWLEHVTLRATYGDALLLRIFEYLGNHDT